MTFTVSARNKSTKARAFNDYNYKRIITMALRDMGIAEEYDQLCYMALATALSEGGWNDKTVADVLNTISNEEDTLIYVKETLKYAGILEARKNVEGMWYYAFTPHFARQADEFLAHHIENLPNQMLPLTDVPMWESAQRNSLNIPMVARVPKKVLDMQPKSVLNTYNKLQAVEFRANPVMREYLQERYQMLLQQNRESKIDRNRTELTVIKNQVQYLTELMDQDTSVQFLVTADFRGRAYYRGGVFTPQGSDFQKAMFEFANPKKLGKMGKVAMAIHYANVCDLDKISTEKKVVWSFNEGTELARRIVEENYYPREFKKKYQVIVAATEWHKLTLWEEQGKKASKFKSRLVCHQDGTCNGLQHGAALRKDHRVAEDTNCLPSSYRDVPRDVYQKGADILVRELKKQGLEAQANLVEEKGRQAMKQPVMITGYGAGLNRAVQACIETFNDDAQKVLNVDRFKDAMQEALKEIAGPLIDTHEHLSQAVEDKMEEGVGPIGWKTADGFFVFQAARASDDDEKEFIGVGDFSYRVDEINRDKQRTSITANFIHSMDACHMRMTVQAFNKDIVTVHDSYGCHAGNYFELNEVIKSQFIEMHKYDQVWSFNQTNDLDVHLDDMGTFHVEDVFESEYFFS